MSLLIFSETKSGAGLVGNGFIERYKYKHSVKQLTKNKNKRKLRDAFKIDKVIKDRTKKVKE